MEIDVIIKIPQGSRNKYEMDAGSGRIRLDRTLHLDPLPRQRAATRHRVAERARARDRSCHPRPWREPGRADPGRRDERRRCAGGWLAVTGRSRWWPQQPLCMTFRSCASRRGHATTSPSMRGEPARCARRDRGVHQRGQAPDRHGGSERPTVPLRRRGPPAGLPRRKGPHPAGDRRSVLGPSGHAPPLRLVDDAGSEYRQLAVVLVPNNPYALDRPLPRARHRPARDCRSRRAWRQCALPGASPGPRRTWRSVPSDRCPRASTVRPCS